MNKPVCGDRHRDFTCDQPRGHEDWHACHNAFDRGLRVTWPLREYEVPAEYVCRSYDKDGRDFGGFSFGAMSMPAALSYAANHIEVQLRPDMPELRIRRKDTK